MNIPKWIVLTLLLGSLCCASLVWMLNSTFNLISICGSHSNLKLVNAKKITNFAKTTERQTKKLRYDSESTNMEYDLNMAASQNYLSLPNPPPTVCLSLFIFGTVPNWHPKFWSPTFLSTLGALKSAGSQCSFPKKEGIFGSWQRIHECSVNLSRPKQKTHAQQLVEHCDQHIIPKWEIYFSKNAWQWSHPSVDCQKKGLIFWWDSYVFTPTWGNDPIWRIFFEWVETTS